MSAARCSACGGGFDEGSTTGLAFCPLCLLRLGLPELDAGRDQGEGVLEHVRVLNIIGEGPRGRVFLAEWTTPGGGLAALKCAKSTTVAPGCEGRLASLDHPSIATVYEAGVGETIGAYAISEYVPGLPMTRFCERWRLSSGDRLELWLQVADAISYAHARGLPHLNLKPTNLLTIEGAVKVLDFEGALPARLDENQGGYRAPEQMTHAPADGRADVFALGVLLRDLMADRPEGASLAGIVRDATCGDPSARTQSVAVMAVRVRTALHELDSIGTSPE